MQHARVAGGLLVLAFLAHAAGYLYFFVDDEGITLVFAKQLLAGHGLSYSPTDGPIEGYSNFLHLLVMTAVLALVSVIGAGREWAFVGGWALSLSAGAMLTWFWWRTAARLELPLEGRLAGAAAVVCSGPLAVWSASSLETVPFSLVFFALIVSTIPTVTSPRLTALLAVVLSLYRIDGFLFAALWLFIRTALAPPDVARPLLRITWPLTACGLALYHGWRTWYFGDWLPLPLRTKVMHKLLVDEGAVVRTAPTGYLEAFLQHQGALWVLGLAGCALLALGWKNGRRATMLALGVAMLLLLGYVGTVGDWMFGWRFLVPLVAPGALLVATGVGFLTSRHLAMGRTASAGVTVLALVSAFQFRAHYQRVEQKPWFYDTPGSPLARAFGPYEDLRQALASRVAPGDVIALHEAGYVPFMLDVENIDTLGLCSAFIGALPTDDAVFTDVGRYYPVTMRPPMHAAEVYPLQRGARWLIARRSWIQTANGGRVPDQVLGGYFGLDTQTAAFVVYRRTDKPDDPRWHHHDAWLENLGHPANLTAAVIEGQHVSPAHLIDALPILHPDQPVDVALDPEWQVNLDVEGVHAVHQVYVEGADAPVSLRLIVTLRDDAGQVVARLRHDVPSGAPLAWHGRLDSPVRAGSAELTVQSRDGTPSSLRLSAVRLMGQSELLRRHAAAHVVYD